MEAFSHQAPVWSNVNALSNSFPLDTTNNRFLTESSKIQDFQDLKLNCPEDISTNTDLNECTADISYGLNVIPSQGNFVSLTWEMTGATEDKSKNTGINQINSHVFYEGTTIVTYTAKGQQDHIVTCSYTVTVIDNEAPVIIAPKNLYLQCDDRIPSAHTTLQAFLNAGGFASDNCNLLVSSFELSNEVKDNGNCPYTINPDISDFRYPWKCIHCKTIDFRFR